MHYGGTYQEPNLSGRTYSSVHFSASPNVAKAVRAYLGRVERSVPKTSFGSCQGLFSSLSLPEVHSGCLPPVIVPDLGNERVSPKRPASSCSFRGSQEGWTKRKHSFWPAHQKVYYWSPRVQEHLAPWGWGAANTPGSATHC